jgi:mycothiol synthase
MRRATLDDLPELALPQAWECRICRESDLASAAETLALAFEDPDWNPDKVRSELTQHPMVDSMFVLVANDVVRSTASAAVNPERFPKEGYVHYVATHPQATGLGLGRLATLATLVRFRELGLSGAVLNTDDHRLPAIITYFKLGFLPVADHESSKGRWQQVLKNLAALPNQRIDDIVVQHVANL